MLGNADNNHCELAAFFRLTRSAHEAGDALEQQITLVDLFSTEGNLHPLFVGERSDMTSISACAPPCFGNKGSKFREPDAFVDMLPRPLMALLLLLLGNTLASYGI